MSKSTRQLWSEYTARSREDQINGWRKFQDALICARQDRDYDTAMQGRPDMNAR